MAQGGGYVPDLCLTRCSRAASSRSIAAEIGRDYDPDLDHGSLLDTPAFQRLPADTPAQPGCTFFQATGHRVCGGFRAYWEAHGLELGDPGVSLQEAVALFGYPISEEFSDPATGLTVQYFERARFEYHPDNPDPHKVLVGRLGAELLEQRDD